MLAGCPQLLEGDFLNEIEPGVALRNSPDAALPDEPADAGVRPLPPTEAGHPQPPPLTPDAGLPTPDPALLQALRSSLAHRYSFSGTGSVAVDSVGAANGALIGAALDGQGSALLRGGGQLVNLPNGLLSSSNDKTIEAWVIWHGGGDWQRLFDFGSSEEGEAARGTGLTYLQLTPRSEYGAMAVGYTNAGLAAETLLHGTLALPIDSQEHVAVVVDSQNNALSLYLNGALNATTPLVERLSSIDDVNMWIGVSQYAADPSLLAELSEFRLYERALGERELELSFQLGADTAQLVAP